MDQNIISDALRQRVFSQPQGISMSDRRNLASKTRRARIADGLTDRRAGIGYYKPRSRTGRPVFEPTMAEKLAAHIKAGGCDQTTKKGGLCQIKPLKGTTTCKVHTGKKANANG